MVLVLEAREVNLKDAAEKIMTFSQWALFGNDNGMGRRGQVGTVMNERNQIDNFKNALNREPGKKRTISEHEVTGRPTYRSSTRRLYTTRRLALFP